MEKRDRLSDLRRGIVPEVFRRKYPSIARLILRMTDMDISYRPDASELVDCIEDEIFSLENDYCIITNYRKSKSDKIVERDYVLVDDFETCNSGYRSASSDSIYEKYYEHRVNAVIYDYSFELILSGRNR